MGNLTEGRNNYASGEVSIMRLQPIDLAFRNMSRDLSYYRIVTILH